MSLGHLAILAYDIGYFNVLYDYGPESARLDMADLRTGRLFEQRF